MGKAWDSTGVGFDSMTWKSVLRVLKPSGYMLAMGGSRTYHRVACAIEDAGFEIRDCLMWLYGTGMPKGKSNLKPGYEPIILARKPGKGINLLEIDKCRVPNANGSDRHPMNVLHDGSDEVLEVFETFGVKKTNPGTARTNHQPGMFGIKTQVGRVLSKGDSGSAARFFYTAKASSKERGEGNNHPTVKPLDLMRWMVRLVTPENGIVLDPFSGSGSTLIAAHLEAMKAIGIEQENNYCLTSVNRIEMT